MKFFRVIPHLLLATLLVACQGDPQPITSPVPEGQEIRYQAQVQELVQQTTAITDRRIHTVLVGSSIFRLWKSAEDDLRLWSPVNHGFGGSRTWELLTYLQELVIDFHPEVVVIYCGSNDINANEGAVGIADRTIEIFETLERSLPYVKTIYVSINRAPQKKDRWDVVDEANALIESACEGRADRWFVDVNEGLFDDAGMPRYDLYLDDHLHFTSEAYDEVFAPRVLDALKCVRPLD
jgi:hypothetical protein